MFINTIITSSVRMVKKDIKEWTAIKIPRGLFDEVTKFLDSKEAYKAGFTSNSSYIVHCVRTDLERRQ